MSWSSTPACDKAAVDFGLCAEFVAQFVVLEEL